MYAMPSGARHNFASEESHSFFQKTKIKDFLGWISLYISRRSSLERKESRQQNRTNHYLQLTLHHRKAAT